MELPSLHTQYVQAYGPPCSCMISIRAGDLGNPLGRNRKWGPARSLKAPHCPSGNPPWIGCFKSEECLQRRRNVRQGASAGSAAVAYSLAEYELPSILTMLNWSLTWYLSDVSMGCNPNSSSIHRLPRQRLSDLGKKARGPIPPIYVRRQRDFNLYLDRCIWPERLCRRNGISQTQLLGLEDMSIADGNPSDSDLHLPQNIDFGLAVQQASGCNAILVSEQFRGPGTTLL